VLALYAIYRRDGQAFVTNYLQLLAAGGSRSPYELLRLFGIDLDSENFWLGGLGVIEEMVRQVE
jgi:oligoendopeptidase F